MNFLAPIFFLWLIFSTVLSSNLGFDGVREPVTTYSKMPVIATSSKIPNIRNKGVSGITKSFIKKSRVRRSTVATLLDDDLTISEDYSNTVAEIAPWSTKNTELESRDLTSMDQPIDLNSEPTNTKTTENMSREQEGSGDLDRLPSTMTDSAVGVTLMQTGGDTGTIDPSQEQELISGSCFHTICDASQLSTGSKRNVIIPEFTNITLLCESLLNATYSDSLHWYFTNGSDHVFRDRSETNSLDLVLSNAQKLDSGTYKCVKKSEEFCCSAAVAIVVYEKPNYNLHLVIMGGVTAGVFAICILLSTLRLIKARRNSRRENMRTRQQPLLSL